MSTYHYDGSITDEVADSSSRRAIKDQIAMIDGVSAITDLLSVVQPAPAALAPVLVAANDSPRRSQARR